jgi:hypothetical protein
VNYNPPTSPAALMGGFDLPTFPKIGRFIFYGASYGQEENTEINIFL